MKKQQQLDDLVQIRIMMEKSTRFLSLSGLSGVFAGIYALIGAYIAHNYLNSGSISEYPGSAIERNFTSEILSRYSFMLLIAFSVLVLSLLTGIIFSFRKAAKSGDKFWNAASKRLMVNLLIPLITGAIFCFVLLKHGFIGLIAPSMLIFYGLALLNGSKYTLDDIRQLGICEIILGVTALFMPGYGLYFWAIGFGFLHIIYGVVMHYKYDT